MAWLKKLYIDGKLGPIHCLVLVNPGRNSLLPLWSYGSSQKIQVAICKSPFHETIENKLIVQWKPAYLWVPQIFSAEHGTNPISKPVITHADVRWISYGSSSNNRDQTRNHHTYRWYSVSEISLNTRKLCLNVSDITTWVGDHPIPTGEKFRVIKSRLLSNKQVDM